MSIVIPAVVIVQSAIILGLVMLGLRHRVSAAFSSVNPPIGGVNSSGRAIPDQHAAQSAPLEPADKAALHDFLNYRHQSERVRPTQFLSRPAVSDASDSRLPASRGRRRFTERFRMMA